MGNTRMRARAFSPLGQTALAPPQLILRNMSCDKTTDFPHDTVPLTPDFPHDTVPLAKMIEIIIYSQRIFLEETYS